jgi:hypothetical protein
MESAKELLEARIVELTQLKDNALAQANAAQGALVELQQWVKHVATPATETPVRAPVRRGRPKKSETTTDEIQAKIGNGADVTDQPSA